MSYINSWSILPASCLFDKLKVTLTEISKEWSSGTVIVAKKPNGSLQFIAGSQGDYGVNIGGRHEAHHDQTMARFGALEIVNILNYKTVDGALEVSSPVPFALETKAAIAVFK